MDNVFSKTIKQIQAIKLLASKATHIMLYGGSRSGKTFIIVFAILVRACKCKSKHIMLRHTFNSIKTSIWMDTLIVVLKVAFPLLRIKWNNSDYFITLPNGSEIWIGGLDDNKRVEKHLGKQYSTIFFNECSQLSYSSIQIMLTRLAERNTLAKKVYYDENPPSKKHWSYWQFIKLLDPIESEPMENPEDYACMVMNPKDNMMNIDEGYLKLLGKMPERDRQRFLEGEFTDDDDGQAYYAFSRERHVKPTEIANGQLIIGMDFNVAPMTAIIAQVINGTFVIHDEVFLMNSDTFKMCDHLLRRKYRGTVIPDSTGKNRRTSGKSDHQILKDHGFTIPYVFNPFVTDRVNNVNRLFTDDRIIINPKCKKLIGDLEKVSWKDNKLDQKTDPLLTHVSDALGYALWHLDPIGTNATKTTITNYR